MGPGDQGGALTAIRNAFWRIYASQNAPRGSIFHLTPTFPVAQNVSFLPRFIRPCQWHSRTAAIKDRNKIYHSSSCIVDLFSTIIVLV